MWTHKRETCFMDDMYIGLGPRGSRHKMEWTVEGFGSRKYLLRDGRGDEQGWQNRKWEGREVEWNHFTLPQRLKENVARLLGSGDTSQTSTSPSSPRSGSATVFCHTQSRTGTSPWKAGFGTMLAMHFRPWCLDTWSVMVPTVGVEQTNVSINFGNCRL